MKVHPECTKECRHAPAKPNGFLVQRRGAREQHEEAILTKAAGRRVEYLGTAMVDEGSMHVWRVGAQPWEPAPRAPEAEEGKQTRAAKVEHRREVWTGSGRTLPELDYSRESEPEREAFPAPQVTSEQPAPAQQPTPVASLAALAEGFGWQVSVTYSRGHVPHASHGTPSRTVKTLWALRMQRGRERAVAVRHDGAWASFWTWSAERFFTRHATLDAFKGRLT